MDLASALAATAQGMSDSYVQEILLPNGEKRKMTSGQLREYNAALSKYFDDSRMFFEERNEVDQIRERTMISNLKLINEGNSPAEDIDVFLRFPKHINVMDDDEAFIYPEQPQPPSYPELRSLYRTVGGESYLNAFHLAPNYELLSTLKGQEIVRDGDVFIVHSTINKLKHGHHKIFEPFYITFDSPERVKSFDIDVRITASNMPNAVEGKFGVRVKEK